jgi:hypothetical protein
MDEFEELVTRMRTVWEECDGEQRTVMRDCVALAVGLASKDISDAESLRSALVHIYQQMERADAYERN